MNFNRSISLVVFTRGDRQKYLQQLIHWRNLRAPGATLVITQNHNRTLGHLVGLSRNDLYRFTGENYVQQISSVALEIRTPLAIHLDDDSLFLPNHLNHAAAKLSNNKQLDFVLGTHSALYIRRRLPLVDIRLRRSMGSSSTALGDDYWYSLYRTNIFRQMCEMYSRIQMIQDGIGEWAWRYFAEKSLRYEVISSRIVARDSLEPFYVTNPLMPRNYIGQIQKWRQNKVKVANLVESYTSAELQDFRLGFFLFMDEIVNQLYDPYDRPKKIPFVLQLVPTSLPKDIIRLLKHFRQKQRLLVKEVRLFARTPWLLLKLSKGWRTQDPLFLDALALLAFLGSNNQKEGKFDGRSRKSTYARGLNRGGKVN